MSLDKEASEHAGVRRLNKKPLLIVGVALILIVAVVIQSIAKRSQAQKAAAEKARPTEKASVVSSKNSFDSLTKDAPNGLIPEANAAPKAPDIPISDAGKTSTSGGSTSNKPGTHDPSGEYSIIPSNSIDGKFKHDEAAEERKRIRQAKRQAYEAALNSPTAVNGGKVESNASQAPAGGLPPQQSANVSAMTEALTSRLASLAGGGAGGSGAQGGGVGGPGDVDPNGQRSKKDFFKGETTGQFGYLTNMREAPISPYEVKAGTVIPAVLISGVNSDLPGMIIAQVSQDVYDTAAGRHLLIPQGTKIVGSYDSMVTFGQNRALVAWNKLTFPDASSLFLGTMPGADQAGYAGFSDKVNHHYIKAFGSALLVSAFSAGIQLSQPQANQNNLRPTASEELSAEIGRQMGQLGMEIARKNLNVQPTIQIRPGYRFMVMVNKDMILEPYMPKSPRTQTE